MQPDIPDPDTKPILVAYDGSPSARIAASWAAVEAAGGGRPLRLAHVMRWPLLELDRLRPGARGTDTPLGSVCHAVLHYAPCPVLLAR